MVHAPEGRPAAIAKIQAALEETQVGACLAAPPLAPLSVRDNVRAGCPSSGRSARTPSSLAPPLQPCTPHTAAQGRGHQPGVHPPPLAPCLLTHLPAAPCPRSNNRSSRARPPASSSCARAPSSLHPRHPPHLPCTPAPHASPQLKGVATNLEFLRAIAADPRYAAGDTTTKFVEGVDYAPHAGAPAAGTGRGRPRGGGDRCAAGHGRGTAPGDER